MASGLVASFVAAAQASVSVLLVIFYGGVAARLGLLNSSSTKALSKVCVRLFLPALLFTKIGAELHAGSAHRYVVVLAWALACHAASFVLGLAGHLLLGMPDWTTVAVMFNNTTSYPLLLVGALDQTGILQALVDAGGGGETTRTALERAKSYFLVFSTVSSCLTFAVGPRLIDTEHAPEPEEEGGEEGEEDKGFLGGVTVTNVDDEAAAGPSGDDDNDAEEEEEEDDDTLARQISRSSGYDPLSGPPPAPVDETTGLLSAPPASSSFRKSVVHFIDPFATAARSPNSFFPSVRHRAKKKQPASAAAAATATATATAGGGLLSPPAVPDHLRRRVSVVPRTAWQRLSPRARWWLLFVADFFNAPLLGALAGAVVGLTPALHRAFFSDAAHGGVFTAWLTASLDDIGGLFVPLPVVVAGVSLYTAAAAYRPDPASSSSSSPPPPPPPLPHAAVAYILLLRFVVWPLASIGAIYWLAAHTALVGDDPMLWFALMLMPTGPPAMKLITLVQVSDAEAGDETTMAKLLTISYLISPVLSFAVVGALHASLASAHA